MGIRKLPYFFSHWFSFLLIAVICIICMVTANSVTAGPFRSATVPNPFTNDPAYFVQFSDIHMTQGAPERTDRLSKVMANVRTKLDPRLTVITGDVTDGTATKRLTEVRKPHRENWIEYQRALTASNYKTDDSEVLEVAGNHDYYNVPSVQSEKNYFRQFATHGSANLTVNHFDYTLGSHAVRILSVNPVKLPSSTVPLGMMPYVERDVLDDIEAAIDRTKVTVIATHYPLSVLWGSKSSSGKSVQKVFEAAAMTITGHLHVTEGDIQHYGSLLAIIGPAGRISDRVGVVSIEGAGAVWHSVDPAVEDVVLVTYPFPLEQLSPDHVFNLNSFPVRMVSFTENALDLEVVIDGVSRGKATVVKKLDGYKSTHFYSLDIEGLSSGTHTLSVKGGATKEFEFFVGQRSPKVRHSLNKVFTPTFFLASVSVAMFLSLLKVVPWWMCMTDTLDRYAKFMFEGEGDIPWYKNFYLGPLYHWSRVRYVPKSMWIVFGVMLLWYIPIPLYFTKIDMITATLWVWGYIASGRLFKYNATFWLLLCYYLFIFIPLVDVASTFYERKRMCAAQIVEIVLFSLLLVLLFAVYIMVLDAAGSVFSIFTAISLYVLIAEYGYVYGQSIVDYRKRQIPVVESDSCSSMDDDEVKEEEKEKDSL